jgi:transposase
MAKDVGGDSAGSEGRRRYWKKEDKRRIVAESFEDGVSVSEVARRYGLNANLVFTWRRQFASAPVEPPAVLPVTIVPSEPLPPPAMPETAGRMEIMLPSGEKIVVGADVEAHALARVIKALRR